MTPTVLPGDRRRASASAARSSHVVWHDVRLVGDEEPDKVIERAYARFMAIHQSVVEHSTTPQLSGKAHGTSTDG